MIEYLPLVLTGLGLTASIFYYASVLKNAENARQREQIQIRIQSADLQYSRAWTHVMFKKTSTREEWMNVFDPVKDPELFAEMIFIRSRFQNLGAMLREKIIDPDLLFKIYPPNAIMITWEHMKPNIMARRDELNDPTSMSEFEYLYDETKKRFPNLIPKTREYE